MNVLRHIAEAFRPAWFARSPHAQMIVSHALFRTPDMDGDALHTVPLSDGDALIVVENQPKQDPLGGVLLLHGLGGSARARYMRSAATRLLDAGFAVFRMNHRGAGQGTGLVRRMYHAGLSDDIHAVLTFLSAAHPAMQFVPVGFSMSGNMLLKYLAENSEGAPFIRGAIAMNPAVDLSRCMRALEGRVNRHYHQRFTRLMKTQYLANAKEEERESLIPTLESVQGIRDFDTRITAPNWGFENEEAYYLSQSALPRFGQIRHPVTLITADDDPIVPAALFGEKPLPEAIQLFVTRGGGHMGYLAAKKTPLGDRQFQDYFLVEAVRAFF